MRLGPRGPPRTQAERMVGGPRFLSHTNRTRRTGPSAASAAESHEPEITAGIQEPRRQLIL